MQVDALVTTSIERGLYSNASSAPKECHEARSGPALEKALNPRSVMQNDDVEAGQEEARMPGLAPPPFPMATQAQPSADQPTADPWADPRLQSEGLRRQRIPRPARLEGAAGGLPDPYHQAHTCASRDLAAGGRGLEDLPAFRHLAALEAAISSGSSLPPLPLALAPARPPRDGDEALVGSIASPVAARQLAPLRSARGCPGTAPMPPSEPASLQKPSAQLLSPGRTGWQGAGPPALDPGSAPRLVYAGRGLLGCARPGHHRGPLATAQWLATESQRLAAEPKKAGPSSAFLLHG